ncbi:MAG: hypothetical protein R6W31_12260, partial [Bacteroidales bacterium]
YLERGPRSIPSVEAMKTISYEISEQLSWSLGPRSKNVPPVNVVIPRWRAPDWYFQSVSGGAMMNFR